MLDASPSGEPSSTRWSDVEFSRQPEAPHSRTAPRWQEFREQHSLGFLIGEHYDADEDGDVDGSDPWYHNVWDERWRLVATYRGADSDPKEQYVLHHAGFDGRGGSSYINDVIVRDRDANTDWDAASDATLEERLFYLTNWRHDVVALLDGQGHQVEHVRYSAFGRAFTLPAGDVDSSGDCSATDVAIVAGWVSSSTYTARADLNLDGSVDSLDQAEMTVGADLGWGASGTRSRLGWSGASRIGGTGLVSARFRAYSPNLGRWLSRDPLSYVQGANVYAYGAGSPIVLVDATGLHAKAAGCGKPYFYAPPLVELPAPTQRETTTLVDSFVDGNCIYFIWKTVITEKGTNFDYDGLDACVQKEWKGFCNVVDAHQDNLKQKLRGCGNSTLGNIIFGAGGLVIGVILAVPTGGLSVILWGAAASGTYTGLVIYHSHDVCTTSALSEYDSNILKAEKDYFGPDIDGPIAGCPLSDFYSDYEVVISEKYAHSKSCWGFPPLF